MGIFENFPYTNFHDLNLDWLLKLTKKNSEDIEALQEIAEPICFYLDAGTSLSSETQDARVTCNASAAEVYRLLAANETPCILNVKVRISQNRAISQGFVSAYRGGRNEVIIVTEGWHLNGDTLERVDAIINGNILGWTSEVTLND